MKKLLVFLAAFLTVSAGWARGGAQGKAMLNIRSADGSVSNYPYQLKVPNTSLTDNGDGTMTLAVTTGSVNTVAVLNQATLQSGATFFVSSGTAVNFNVGVLSSTQGVTLTNACGYILGTVVQSSQTISKVATTSVGTGYTITPTSATLTPKCVTDLVRISVTGHCQAFSAAGLARTSIFRASTDLSPGGLGFSQMQINAANSLTPVGYTFLDSPATVAQTSWSLRIASPLGAADAIWNAYTSPAVILLEEIAQ